MFKRHEMPANELLKEAEKIASVLELKDMEKAIRTHRYIENQFYLSKIQKYNDVEITQIIHAIISAINKSKMKNARRLFQINKKKIEELDKKIFEGLSLAVQEVKSVNTKPLHKIRAEVELADLEGDWIKIIKATTDLDNYKFGRDIMPAALHLTYLWRERGKILRDISKEYDKAIIAFLQALLFSFLEHEYGKYKRNFIVGQASSVLLRSGDYLGSSILNLILARHILPFRAVSYIDKDSEFPEVTELRNKEIKNVLPILYIYDIVNLLIDIFVNVGDIKTAKLLATMVVVDAKSRDNYRGMMIGYLFLSRITNFEERDKEETKLYKKAEKYAELSKDSQTEKFLKTRKLPFRNII